jgi:hypothetical protein
VQKLGINFIIKVIARDFPAILACLGTLVLIYGFSVGLMFSGFQINEITTIGTGMIAFGIIVYVAERLFLRKK